MEGASSPTMVQANNDEIDGLLRRETSKWVLREDLPSNANILDGRFFLANKNPVTREEKYKARFILKVTEIAISST